ncbi:GNAT family N-acetyltransferase [Legionella cardiaca]|uniref:GNAT family N-acetyltransferase n=1 Tax=Legionella cardiaca TaxID=1071983 RepID=A0ABY8ASW6_9GAMM|nr:GNAT family N-acetyltransferase [Legionella cardiaca]WED42864.1 GNAT family N-acetyltransferase [Legionella cardiaca]
MPTLEDLQDENTLKECFSRRLRRALKECPFKLQLLSDDDPEIEDADLLIEETFPEKEAEQYKPSYLLSSLKNVAVLACLKKGVVIGVITVNIDDQDAELHSLAIDKNYRNQKIGSLLMIAVHDLCVALDVTNISLISSAYGQSFYESFHFKTMALQSYEASLPFKRSIIKNKLDSFMDCHSKSKKRELVISDSSLFSEKKRRCIEKEDTPTITPSN